MKKRKHTMNPTPLLSSCKKQKKTYHYIPRDILFQIAFFLEPKHFFSLKNTCRDWLNFFENSPQAITLYEHYLMYLGIDVRFANLQMTSNNQILLNHLTNLCFGKHFTNNCVLQIFPKHSAIGRDWSKINHYFVATLQHNELTIYEINDNHRQIINVFQLPRGSDIVFDEILNNKLVIYSEQEYRIYDIHSVDKGPKCRIPIMYSRKYDLSFIGDLLLDYDEHEGVVIWETEEGGIVQTVTPPADKKIMSAKLFPKLDKTLFVVIYDFFEIETYEVGNPLPICTFSPSISPTSKVTLKQGFVGHYAFRAQLGNSSFELFFRDVFSGNAIEFSESIDDDYIRFYPIDSHIIQACDKIYDIEKHICWNQIFTKKEICYTDGNIFILGKDVKKKRKYKICIRYKDQLRKIACTNKVENDYKAYKGREVIYKFGKILSYCKDLIIFDFEN